VPRPQTLYEKIWQSHVVRSNEDGSALLYIDRHLVHEVTSPQAFAGLRQSARKVRRPELTLAMADHNVPTSKDRSFIVRDADSRLQLDILAKNAREFGITYFGMDDPRQGIVHVVGPEHGFTLPGMTIVCGDSHTSTHGAFAALAFGIGTSEVEHVLATQTLRAKPARTMRVNMDGALPFGVTSKDLILSLIGTIGTAGATGYVIEYAGEAVRNLSMEGRMTVCNMSIEAGARAGLIAPDEVTFAYLKVRASAVKGPTWERAEARWRNLPSDDGASYDKEISLDASAIAPQVSWGTSPEQVAPITASVPDPSAISDAAKRQGVLRALEYMDLKPGTKLTDIAIDRVFIGSCTNGRLEDLRAAAAVTKGRRVASHVQAMVVPGSGLVKREAEAEGIARAFIAAGFEWREPGCSLCLGMNDDRLKPGERCASTSNRNFEGRQGRGGRTHLLSPAMAAAAAITGRLSDVRELMR